MMMLGRTELLYLDDSYLREFKAKIVDVIADGVILDRKSFHPAGGGLLSDKGMISFAGSISEVAEVLQDGKNILHRIAGSPPSIGEKVEARLDWDRRYAMMRLHTAIHVLAAVMMKTSATITGNSIGPEQARVDFSVESFDRAVLEERFADANRLLQEVKIHYMGEEEGSSHTGSGEARSQNASQHTCAETS
jgi:misacylated tRNA(Ala) deacylase